MTMPRPADRSQRLYVINPARFAQMANAGLGAMARHDFLSVDVAVACLFSLQNLRPNIGRRTPAGTAASGTDPFLPAMDTIMIDDLSLVLDDGELVSHR